MSHTRALGRTLVALTGGLDSTFCLLGLRRANDLYSEFGVRYSTDSLAALTVDLGIAKDTIIQCEQFCNSMDVPWSRLDLQGEFLSDWTPRGFKANALDGTGGLLHAITVQFVAAKIFEHARENGFDTVVVGSTGIGNDHLRFKSVANALQATCNMVYPVRDCVASRQAQSRFLRERGAPHMFAETDHEDCIYFRLINTRPVTQKRQRLGRMVWVQKQKIVKRGFSFDLCRGLPKMLCVRNSKELAMLNAELGATGYGLRYGIDKALSGLPTIVTYEAPAIAALQEGHRFIEECVFEPLELLAKTELDKRWHYLIHRGMWFCQEREQIDHDIELTQRGLNYTVHVEVENGQIWFSIDDRGGSQGTL